MRANADIADIAIDVTADAGEDVAKDVVEAASVAGVTHSIAAAYVPTHMLYTHSPNKLGHLGE